MRTKWVFKSQLIENIKLFLSFIVQNLFLFAKLISVAFNASQFHNQAVSVTEEVSQEIGMTTKN